MSDSPHTEAPRALARVVGLPGAVLLGLGSILGTGVFVSLGIAAGLVGEGLVVAVVLAGLLATANGLSSAQLAAAHPVSGGTYEYGHRFVHPTAGWAAGWMFLAAKSASAATAALGCAGYLLEAFGHGSTSGGYPAARVALALFLVAVVTALVAGGLRRSNVANAVVVTVTIAALALFVATGVADIVGRGGAAAGSAGGAALGPFGAALADPMALLHATALMFVAYTGYGRIATLGEEVRDPGRTIPRAVVVTLAVSMLIYASVAVTAVSVFGPRPFAELTLRSAAPLEVLARSFAGPVVASIVALGAVTAMLGVLLNLLLGLSRVLLAMARRGEMPGGLAAVHAGSASPVAAVLATGAVVGALALAGDIGLTWSFSAFTVLVYYGLTNLAALRLRPESRRFPRWLASGGLVSCLGLAFFVPVSVSAAGLVTLGTGFAVRAVVTGAR